MSASRAENLKRLFLFNKKIPITTTKLKQTGISPSLARKYKNSGWLESIGTGAFKFPASALTVEGLLHALQNDMGLNIYAGAKTALEMAGVRQFLRIKEKIYLYTDNKTNLPLWVKRHLWGREFKVITSSKWKKTKFYFNPGTKEFDFLIATAELAILEQIELINRGESFMETAELFEVLDSLNPGTINELLKEASIKARRIFLFLSDFYNHPWKRKLAPELIAHGNSVITIEKGGRYLKNYHMVIPRGFDV